MNGKLELAYKSLFRGFMKLCESHGFEVFLNEEPASSFAEYDNYIHGIMNDPYYIDFYEDDNYFEVQLPYLQSDEYTTKYASLLAILKNLYYPFYHEDSPVAVNYNKLRMSVKKSFAQYNIPFVLFTYELLGTIPSEYIRKLLSIEINVNDSEAVLPAVLSIFPSDFVVEKGEWRFVLITYMLLTRVS